MGKINKPELLKDFHSVESFCSGDKNLDEWLKTRALKNNYLGASKTFVTHIDNRVIGYYALATGSIARAEMPGKVRRNMPNEIPVIILGRLAIDSQHQGEGIGAGLLKDAVIRTYNVSEEIGLKVMLVHAISEKAVFFYKRFGFKASPVNNMTLFLSIERMKNITDDV